MHKSIKENNNITTQGTMQKSKPKVAILLAGNDAVDFAIANVIIGLKRYNEDLITNIFIYHDIKQETREKISSLWKDKIIWIPYAYEDFLKDVDYDIGEIPIPQGSRWGHFIYAKFHIFTHLKDYDYAIWLDTDILILDSLEDLLAKEVDCQWRNGLRRPIQQYLEKTSTLFLQRQISKPNGGVLIFSNTILHKNPKNLNFTQESFKILKEIYSLQILDEQAMADEIPFGVFVHHYNWKLLFLQKANIMPQEDKNDSIIIHGPSALKFWTNPFSFVIYQEWFKNHKIWLQHSHSNQEIILKNTKFPIKTRGELFSFLLALQYFEPLLTPIHKKINEDLSIYNLYTIPPLYNRYFDIHSTHLNKNIFYRFVFNHNYGGWDITCQIQIVCTDPQKIKEGKIISFLEDFINKETTFALKHNIDKNGNPTSSYITKNIDLKNIPICITEFEKLIKLTFESLNEIFNINSNFKTTMLIHKIGESFVEINAMNNKSGGGGADIIHTQTSFHLFQICKKNA